MTFETFAGSHGHALSSLEWLLLHHRAKEAARRRSAEHLCLFPGMSVIDLGCGPGLWCNLLAEQVAPHGTVLGLDLDAKLIGYAREHSKEVTGVEVRFEEGDFHHLEHFERKFDLAFSANCLAYFEDAEGVVRSFKRVVKPGGMITLRHFDNTFWLSNPIDPGLSAAVFHWAALAGRRDTEGRYFNNSLGQELHRICRGAGLSDIRTESASVDLCGPLSPAARDYLSLTAEWTARLASGKGDSELVDTWLAHFDPASATYVLRDIDCLFTFLDFTCTGFVREE